MLVQFLGQFHNNKTLQTKILTILEHNLWEYRNEPLGKLEQKVKNVYGKIRNIGDFEQSVSEFDFLSELAPDLHPEIYQQFNKTRFFRYVRRRFFKPKKFTFYYPLGDIKNLTSIELGYGTSLTFSKLPHKVQQFFINTWNGDSDYRPELIANKKDLIKKRRKYLFLKFEILSIGSEKAQKYAYSIANESLHILRYVSDVDCGTLESSFNEGNDDYYSSSQVGNKITEIIGFNKTMRNEIKILTNIFQKDNKTQLEEKIMDAIIMCGISTQIEYNAVRLLMQFSALETLFLAERGNIGYKLAERIAFLINTRKKRMDVFNEIVGLYAKRSVYTHKGKETATKNDVEKLNYYFKSAIRKAIKLKDKGYEKVDDPFNKKSISYLVNVIKFRHKIQ